MDEFSNVRDYVTKGVYPEGLSKNDKGSFRKKVRSSYLVPSYGTEAR